MQEKRFRLKNNIKFHRINKKYIVINPDFANWFVINKDAKSLLKKLDGSKSIKEIEKNINYDKKTIDRLISALSDGNFLMNDDEDNSKPFLNIKYWPPYHIFLNITDDCNYRCLYCYNTSGVTRNYMDQQTAQKIIEQMINLPNNKVCILIHGGEPLLNFPLIKNIVEYIKLTKCNKKIELFIQTNASLMNDEIAKFLNDSGIQISISLDGSEKTHNKWRQYENSKGTYYDTMKGIDILNRNHVKYNVLTVLTSANYSKTGKVVEHFYKQGIDLMGIAYFNPAGRGYKNKSQIQISSNQLYIAMMNLLRKLIKYNGKIKERTISSLLLNILTKKRKNLCMRSPCGAGTSLLSFTPQGDIYPCDDFRHINEFKIGNIWDGDLLNILEKSPVIASFSKRVVDNISKCRECEWKWICCGGCAARAFWTYNTLWKEDPLCDYFKKIIPAMIKVISQKNITYLI